MRSTETGQTGRWRRRLAFMALGVVAILLLIQVVPFGHEHSDPAVQAEPAWDSPTTRALAQRACFACHSNQTTWPWYSNVAPVSWLVQRDVNDGRRALNFSEWNTPQRRSRRAVRAVQDGGMPPWYFLPLHAQAKLTDAEKQQLIQGLTATLAQSPPGQSR
jgi:cytochrome c551/c552